MKILNEFLIESKYEDAVKSATRVLVRRFGFKKVRRGPEEGVEKDGKYCQVQVCEMPYDSCIVVDARKLASSRRIFDYLVYIDTRKKFQNKAYVIEADSLLEYIMREHNKTSVLWPTTKSERGTGNINPPGITVRIHALKKSGWCTEIMPAENLNNTKTGFFPTDSDSDFLF